MGTNNTSNSNQFVPSKYAKTDTTIKNIKSQISFSFNPFVNNLQIYSNTKEILIIITSLPTIAITFILIFEIEDSDMELNPIHNPSRMYISFE